MPTIKLFSTTSEDTVYRGRKRRSDEEVREIYCGYTLPESRGMKLPQLIDFFSLPWAGLLAKLVDYLQRKTIPFEPVITFDGSFDFGYLIKLILFGELPAEQEEFFRYHRAFFPTSYDIKTLLRQPGPASANLKGGLQEIANQLQVPRIGQQQHQAGFNSLLTAMTFFELKERFADNWKKVAEATRGDIFGLNNS